MRKQVPTCVVLFLLFLGGFISAQNTFKSVKIGKQVWTTENLNISKFQNGDPIPEVQSLTEWVKAGKEHTPAWCYYNNDPVNGKKYGRLYNWYAVTDKRGFAPKGWHMPTDAEWDTLYHCIGGQQEAGGKMKTNTGWENNGNGNNSSGFSALPAGIRYSEGNFSHIGKYGDFWSCTESHTDAAWYNDVCYDYAGVILFEGMKACGFSVRCIKDN